MTRSMLAPVSYITAATVLIVAYLVAEPTRAVEWLIPAASALAALSVIVSVASHRPIRPVPWLLMAAGLVLITAAHAVAVDERFGGAATGLPGAGTAIGVLAIPALLVATISITSDRRHARDLLAGSEPVMYTLALTALTWVIVTGPYLDDRAVPGDRALWIVLMPLLGLVLTVVALRRMDASEPGHSVFRVLVLGFATLGASHGLVSWAISEDRLEAGSPIAASVMVGPLLIGLVPLLPSVRMLTGGTGAPFRTHWVQFVGLLLAATLPLAALIIAVLDGDPPASTVLVASVATVGVIALALGRMWGLVDQVRLLTEQRGHDRLAAMVEHSSDVVMLCDLHGKVSYASPGLRSTLGFDPNSWPGRYLFDVVVEAQRDDALRHFERLVEAGHGGTVDFEATLIHANGQHRSATVVAANLVGGAAVEGIVATFRDVTEQRDLERQLSHRANHDELTGLANRAMFVDRMDHALRVARQVTDPVVTLFVDLDDFKSVNDALGHGVGDQLLRTVADRIRAVAGPGDTAARLGGDEFAILLEDRGGIERAIDVAESLLESLRDPLPIAGYEVVVLASIGVAVAQAGMTSANLLRDADIAMYEAKKAGKGQIRIFDPAMRLAATTHLEYRTDLNDALDKNQLRLVFLPFVDLRNGQVTGAEALVRWAHPKHGEVAPNDFIPLAERSGMIVPIGYWIIEQAMMQVQRWRPGLFVSLNLSPVQLRQPDFVDRVVGMLDRHGCDPKMVILEINETVLVDEADRAGDALDRLRSEGFKLAIDDFGSGYCSLSQLQRQPVDLLKIDPIATAEMTTVGDDHSLGTTILQTTASLGIPTAAEGIETPEQLEELRRNGCKLGQGFLLSPPLEADDIATRFGVHAAAS